MEPASSTGRVRPARLAGAARSHALRAIAARATPGVRFGAVAADSDSLIHPSPPDRRPAIWPWLVMPLVALALFCGLSRLRQMQDTIHVEARPISAASVPADPENP